MDGNAAYFSQYLNAYTPYKKSWNYEDSCVLVGPGPGPLFRPQGDRGRAV